MFYSRNIWQWCLVTSAASWSKYSSGSSGRGSFNFDLGLYALLLLSYRVLLLIINVCWSLKNIFQSLIKWLEKVKEKQLNLLLRSGIKYGLPKLMLGKIYCFQEELGAFWGKSSSNHTKIAQVNHTKKEEPNKYVQSYIK